MTLCSCVPDRELRGGFVFFNFGRRKGRDAVSQEREPSQPATVPDANYCCHPSALGVQQNVEWPTSLINKLSTRSLRRQGDRDGVIGRITQVGNIDFSSWPFNLCTVKSTLTQPLVLDTKILLLKCRGGRRNCPTGSVSVYFPTWFHSKILVINPEVQNKQFP